MIELNLKTKRKGNKNLLYLNKETKDYDVLNINSTDMFNSERVLKENKIREILGDSIGYTPKSVEQTICNFTLLYYNKTGTILEEKIKKEFAELKEVVFELERHTDKALGIQYKIAKKNEDDIAIVQTFENVPINEVVIKKNEKFSDKIIEVPNTRIGIAQKVAEKLEKQLNIDREYFGDNKELDNFRVKQTDLIGGRVIFVIDKKIYDKADNKYLWETVKDGVKLDVEVIKEYAKLVKEQEAKNKKINLILHQDKSKLELNKNLTDKDVVKLVNIIKGSKAESILKNEQYFEFDKNGNIKDINRKDKNLATIAVLGAYLLLNNYSENYIEFKENNIRVNNIDLNNTKYIKRALNLIEEFENKDKPLKDFEKENISRLAVISMLSLAGIDELSKDTTLIKNEKMIAELENRKTYLEKYAMIDDIENELWGRTDHISELNMTEVLIDLYDGNTSPEQRRLLELKLLELQEDEEKRKKVEKELKKQFDEKERKIAEFLLLMPMLVLPNVIEEKEEMAKQNLLLFQKPLEEVTLKKKVDKVKELIEKELLELGNVEEELLEEKLKEKESKFDEISRIVFFDNEDVEEIERSDKVIELEKLLEDYETGEDLAKFGFYFERKGRNLELKSKGGNVVIDRIKDINDNEEPAYIVKILKAMERANSAKIDFDNSKSIALQHNVQHNGDIVTEYQLLHNTPEKILRDGYAELEKSRKNIFTKVIEERAKTGISDELDMKITEIEISKIPDEKAKTKIEEIVKLNEKAVIEKDLFKSDVVKEIEDKAKKEVEKEREKRSGGLEF